MANLTEKINNDLKHALKERRELELSVLRMLTAAMQNKKIELKSKDDLTDEQAVAVVQGEVKKRKDSVEAYKLGGRQDLADKEIKEIEILDKYMPEQMDDAEIEKEVKRVIETLGEVSPQDFGRVMGLTMTRVKGRADGNKVSEAVKRLLAQMAVDSE